MFESVQVDMSLQTFNLSSMACVQISKNRYVGDTRPDENGQGAIVRATTDGAITDVSLSEFSALSQVHEYRGACFVPHATDGHIVFTDIASKASLDLDPATGSDGIILEGDPKA